MGRLLDLALYNPSRLGEDDFLRGFVARHDLLHKILDRLGDVPLKGIAQHRLLLGQRGMGKTSLLRRIAIGVRDSDSLAQVLVPLTFREEQYNVHDLHVFWVNCLEALGDWFEANKHLDQARQLDRDTAALTNRQDDDEGSAAQELFRQWMKTTGRRPLLLLDNIDLILAGLKKKEWSLRRALQETDGVVVIGASSNYLESMARPGGAFYDFFQVDVLRHLEQDQLVSCLRSLARQRGEPGKQVNRILDEEPGRVRALYDLTGGNPRTLAMLYVVLEMGDDSDLMRDLERLLDQATPLYKARAEELAMQARVVLDAVALAWNPTTASDLAKATGLETGAVSTQLDRLQREGVVDKVSLSSTTRGGYQIGERFFNIWYLMRHAPRRQRARLRWLTEFLRGFYTPPQLSDLAVGVFARRTIDSLSRGSDRLALSDAVDDPTLRSMLRDTAREDLERYAAEAGVPLGALVDLSEPVGEGTAREWYARAWTRTSKEQWSAGEFAYRKAIELDPKYASLWNGLGRLLMDRLGRSKEAEAALAKSLEIDPESVSAAVNLVYLRLAGGNRGEDTEAIFQQTVGNLSQTGGGLLKAFRALAQGDFTLAIAEIREPLEIGRPDLLSGHLDDLLRVLRFAAERGFGERLLAWFDETGFGDRYWPLRAAFDAYLNGENRFMDVNPEVRLSAQWIFDWFDSPRRWAEGLKEGSGPEAREPRRRSSVKAGRRR